MILQQLNTLKKQTINAKTKIELQGIEGRAAALYFQAFPMMISNPDFIDVFKSRNRRPPRDPVNAMLSLGYSVLSSEIAGVCSSIGLDPACGILHVPRFGRPALALDLMEEFRPLIVDSVVISLLNRMEVNLNDFIFTSNGCNLQRSGHRAFWKNYSRRLNEEVTHPVFGYKMSYRRMLEIQASQLWRIFRGDAHLYHPMTTR